MNIETHVFGCGSDDLRALVSPKRSAASVFEQAESWKFLSLLQTAAGLEQADALQRLTVEHVDALEDWISWICV